MVYGTLGRIAGLLLPVGILFLPGNNLVTLGKSRCFLTLGRLPTFSKVFL